MRTVSALTLAMSLLTLPLAAQTAGVCGRPIIPHGMAIAVEGSHRFQVYGQDAKDADLLPIVSKARRENAVTTVFLIAEPEATYAEVQTLADRVLTENAGMRVVFLQPPADHGDDFRCVLAGKSVVTNKLMQRIPTAIPK